MNPIQTIIKKKQLATKVSISDFFEEEDDPDWRKHHPLGPVHVQIRCKICDLVVERDLKEFGWFHNQQFVRSNLLPHLITHET